MTYVGTIIQNRKCLPVALKTTKGCQVISLKYIWKSNSSVMIVSYYLKLNKNILLVSAAHSEADTWEEAYRKAFRF